jgi:DNA processing protein
MLNQPGQSAHHALLRALVIARPADLASFTVIPRPSMPRRFARPEARGDLDLRACCARSIAIVGSRAASGYGAHAAGEIAANLADRG